MVDIQTISIAIASAGVFVAAIYYVLQLRHQTRMRQSDLLMRMHLASTSKEFCDAVLKMLSTDYEDYDDFLKKYGHPFAVGPVQTEFLMMAMYFEGLGILSKRKLVDPSLVTDLFSVGMAWEKMKPLTEGLRRQMKEGPRVWEFVEYLANEEKKRFPTTSR